MKYHVEFDLEFKKNPYKGLYVALEGINACGKTTQVGHLKKYFEKKGRKVVVTSEPNDSLPIGKLVREVVTKKITFPSSSLQYLYTADRIINFETIIIPALKKGNVVLSSRTFWSGLVYGVLDKGGVNYSRNDANLLLVAQGVLSMYHQFMTPDYTFFLDVSLQTVLERMEKMGRELDIYENSERLPQLIKGYKWVAKQFEAEFITVDGEKTVEEVTKEIVATISRIKR